MNLLVSQKTPNHHLQAKPIDLGALAAAKPVQRFRTRRSEMRGWERLGRFARAKD